MIHPHFGHSLGLTPPGALHCAGPHCSMFDTASLTFGPYQDILAAGGNGDAMGRDLSNGAPTAA